MSPPTGSAVVHDEAALRCEVGMRSSMVAVARCRSRLLLVAGDAIALDGDRTVPAARLGAAISVDPVDALRRLSGAFLTFFVDLDARTALLATDRAATRSPCYSLVGGEFVAGLTATDVTRMRSRGAELSRQAIYDYFYFHVIPAPRTIFDGVARLLPGEFVQIEDGGARVRPYWKPGYVRVPRTLTQAKTEFRELLRSAVASQLAGPQVGAFLSGGTDSSTVAGMLGEVTGEPARTYSIGFDVPGYDEMGFARVAAKHFGTRHHEYYLTPADLLPSIPALAASHDQPFGNSSVVPAHFCARLAHADGVGKLLGGDGGDEIFGGNARYARQKLFDAYHRLPKWLARAVAEPLLLNGVAARLPVVRKARSYVEQARLPMPARMHTYNLVDRIGPERIFDAGFLGAVDPGDPARRQDAYYAECSDPELINRILYFDWKYTLSDNDLPKVVSACDLADVAVGFPLLDEHLVAFANSLPADWKVRRLALRHFFKYALADFLPRAILTKKKHGFGMPFGQWLVAHDPLRAMALGSLESLRDRGIVRRAFFDELLRRVTTEHAGFYGELVWVMFMLEQWLGAHRPDYTFDGSVADAHLAMPA